MIYSFMFSFILCIFIFVPVMTCKNTLNLHFSQFTFFLKFIIIFKDYETLVHMQKLMAFLHIMWCLQLYQFSDLCMID